MIRTFTFSMAALLAFASAGLGFFWDGLPPACKQVLAIVKSSELSKDQKIARLKELVGSDDAWMFALEHLELLDFREAMQTALAAFRAKEAPREVKLRLGHFLLERGRPLEKDFPKGFDKEFAQYLVSAILDGGEKEFCRELDDRLLTAVGEYAYLASDFEGYKDIDFTPFKDARLVPILIRCLDAPDTVQPSYAGFGDGNQPKPVKSPGRNTARQQIPLALAKFGDPRVVEPLKNVLLNHHDIYGRKNAAYVLTKLLTRKEDRAAIGKQILARPELLRCRLPFGKGLIEAGDDAGVEFLGIKHAGGYGRLESPDNCLYMLRHRLDVLAGFKSPKIEGFVREALGFKPFRAILLFEPGLAEAGSAAYRNPPADEAEALDRVASGITKVYGSLLKCVETNQLKGLSADLEEIARSTRSEKIRQMTNACLKSLAG